MKRGIWDGKAPASCGNRSAASDAWSHIQWRLPRDAEVAVLKAVEHLRGMSDDLELAVRSCGLPPAAAAHAHC